MLQQANQLINQFQVLTPELDFDGTGQIFDLISVEGMAL